MRGAQADQLARLERNLRAIVDVISSREDGERYIPLARRLESEIALRLNEQSDLDRYRSMHQAQMRS